MVNIEKIFDSANHLFRFNMFKKFRFAKNFKEWIKLLLENEESHTTGEGVGDGEGAVEYRRFYTKKRNILIGSWICISVLPAVKKIVFAVIMQWLH